MTNLPAIPVPFAKMNGSGNDFVVIDNRTGVILPEAVSDFARMTCRRGLGEGADGVVLIDTAPANDVVDFSWRYINADGSEGDMCGNGAMCGARFAVDAGIAPANCRFSTPAGVIAAEVLDGGPAVRLAMVDATILRRGMALDDGADVTTFDLIRVGVPHVVAVAPDVDDFSDFDARGRSIRYHENLAPEGANVNLIHRIAPDTIRMRTWERGVEAETLACGTGAVASAIVAASHGLIDQPVRVITSSGRPLIVTWTQNGDLSQDVHLTGEARFVARGVLDPEGFS
ncbi:MAG TPA: diaminopimelate epimerase [Thermomicrobiales bacterium]|nr:diaminopimelate epimerase [Thermomicrobiales bacterium]